MFSHLCNSLDIQNVWHKKSSDSDVGRHPKLKSDEFFVQTF